MYFLCLLQVGLMFTMQELRTASGPVALNSYYNLSLATRGLHVVSILSFSSLSGFPSYYLILDRETKIKSSYFGDNFFIGKDMVIVDRIILSACTFYLFMV